jgi:hypothetical protein
MKGRSRTGENQQGKKRLRRRPPEDKMLFRIHCHYFLR